MVVPATGALSLKGIANEKNQDDYTSDDGEVENNISLRGLSNNSFNDYGSENIALNSLSAANAPNQTEPYGMDEFRGYNHDEAIAAFTYTYGTSDVSVPSSAIEVSGTGASFSSTFTKVMAQINLTWGSGGFSWSWVDDHINCGLFEGGADTNSSGQSPAFQVTNFNITSVDKVEVRWRIVGGKALISSGTGNEINANYHRTGSQATLNQSNSDSTNVIRSSAATSFNFTDSWYEVSPAALQFMNPNLYSNSQSYSISCEIGGATSAYDGDTVTLKLNSGSSNGIFFDVRITGANGSGGTKTETKSFKKGYSSVNNPRIQADEYEPPDFTCIMPDMIVREKTKGFMRIGDIVVGDRILAPVNLKEQDFKQQYVEVVNRKVHTRKGYWNVEGVHITNDHPVWLTHKGKGDWVKVEDMRSGITRNYVEGTVDPIYLGTNPGWYYVWSADRTKGFTVSGDYAKETTD